MHLSPAVDKTPRMSFVTEAGLLAKTGLNSDGVAVFMNAILARGIKFAALPMHVALRTVLEAETRLQAIAKLQFLTLGAAGHIMIAHRTGATSLEFSHLDVIQMEMFEGQIAHTNHFLNRHDPRVIDSNIFSDSLERMTRVRELLREKRGNEVACGSEAVVLGDFMLQDEQGFPTAINRKASPVKDSETLFSIMVDLQEKTGIVKLGRPNEPEGIWILQPGKTHFHQARKQN
ncbi:peptidase C45 acyl-coenzyme A:6-aminopenicillanic acid acyl-transferase [Acrodontium crateriforme]|uniref:Peptidase C45 acyl-coenzyme A:6-aminopenicillanic acid acyl-transferase n=1 Tax=Acrodontium crateriforme TaxID=150365 RepID=A0AAQ3M2X6_9PEZI|nr:peptidase C45 acyl-coenzyme A:6-aminopenicillanic acid acyl-transferase [Acrodontium crateriforme]